MALPPAILLIGPTASGKTALAFELATRFPCDIVSVDSAQVFRDMDIGTAKPDAATLARFPHRLIDLITPEERYSAAASAATPCAKWRASPPPAASRCWSAAPCCIQGPARRPRRTAAGRPRVAREIDTEAARKAGPRCTPNWPASTPTPRRASSPTMPSASSARWKSCASPAARWAASSPNKPPVPCPSAAQLALVPRGPQRTARPHRERFAAMLSAGLVDEVALREKYRLDAGLPSMRCVGYRQVWEMLEGELPAKELRERGVYATRQFAKRQLTWLRSMEGLTVVDPLAANAGAEVMALVERHLA
jgi:tRNA dimethylallyltransferase